MPRGVEFTKQQREVLSQIMKAAWARHRGSTPKMTRRWVNPTPKKCGITEDGIRCTLPATYILHFPLRNLHYAVCTKHSKFTRKDRPPEPFYLERIKK